MLIIIKHIFAITYILHFTNFLACKLDLDLTIPWVKIGHDVTLYIINSMFIRSKQLHILYIECILSMLTLASYDALGSIIITYIVINY